MMVEQQKQNKRLKRKVTELRRQIDALEGEIVTRSRRAENKNKRLTAISELLRNELDRI